MASKNGIGPPPPPPLVDASKPQNIGNDAWHDEEGFASISNEVTSNLLDYMPLQAISPQATHFIPAVKPPPPEPAQPPPRPWGIHWALVGSDWTLCLQCNAKELLKHGHSIAMEFVEQEQEINLRDNPPDVELQTAVDKYCGWTDQMVTFASLIGEGPYCGMTAIGAAQNKKSCAQTGYLALAVAILATDKPNYESFENWWQSQAPELHTMVDEAICKRRACEAGVGQEPPGFMPAYLNLFPVAPAQSSLPLQVFTIFQHPLFLAAPQHRQHLRIQLLGKW